MKVATKFGSILTASVLATGFVVLPHVVRPAPSEQPLPTVLQAELDRSDNELVLVVRWDNRKGQGFPRIDYLIGHREAYILVDPSQVGDYEDSNPAGNLWVYRPSNYDGHSSVTLRASATLQWPEPKIVSVTVDHGERHCHNIKKVPTKCLMPAG